MNSCETSNSFMWPKIFSQKENILSRFKRYNIDTLGLRPNKILPTIQYLKNGNYVIWNGGTSWSQSAWNDTVELSTPGWVSPTIIDNRDMESTCWLRDTPKFSGNVSWPEYSKSDIKSNPEVIKLDGRYAGFHTWWSHNYGHILHDTIPYLLWFKEQLPEDCQFLLLEDPVAQQIIYSIDQCLYNNITWLKRGQVASIRGELYTTSPNKHPFIRVLEFQSYLKNWLMQNHKGGEPTDIIYHTRAGTSNRRLLDHNHETQIIQTIKRLMTEHNIKGDLKIFSGKNENGQTLSVEEQINIFKNAHTVIGPHSTGLINILYSNLNKVKLLEFIPSEECAEVQAPFNSFYHLIPALGIDYNILLYTDNSVSERTFINLTDLEDALNTMWKSK